MRVLILGATGSIGKQTIEVIKKIHYQLVGISFYKNDKTALKIKTRYKYSPINSLHSNVNSYDELVRKSNPDLVVNAIVGFAGLEATLSTIRNKKTLLLANKESLVVAGKFVMKLAKQNNVHIYLIDSEHASVYQILKDNPKLKPKKIYITASGGPFYNYSQKQLLKVSYEQAIKHPNWKMGAKISIDSATLMNKCFEIIEAYWYFGMKNIEALYHPASQIHAIVKFSNNTFLQFVSKPDMHLPIEQALTLFAEKLPYVKPINLSTSNELHMISTEKYIPIAWARKFLENVDSPLPIVLNASNEVAVELFTKKLIRYVDILKVIADCVNNSRWIAPKTIEDIYKIDKEVRIYSMNRWIKK